MYSANPSCYINPFDQFFPYFPNEKTLWKNVCYINPNCYSSKPNPEQISCASRRFALLSRGVQKGQDKGRRQN